MILLCKIQIIQQSKKYLSIAQTNDTSFSFTPYFQSLYIPYHRSNTDDPIEAKKNILKAVFSHNRKTTGHVVIIVNFGLHFNTGDEAVYEQNLKDMLQFYKHIVTEHPKRIIIIIVIFRETTAQHFNTPTGLFDKKLRQDYNVHVRDPTVLLENRLHVFGLKKGPLPIPASNYEKPEGNYYSELNGKLVIPEFNKCEPLITTMEAVEANNWRNRMMYKVLDDIDPVDVL